VIAPRVRAGERVLIVAHANTIRALIKAVDNIDDEMIAYLKIPNGVPLVYALDENLKFKLKMKKTEQMKKIIQSITIAIFFTLSTHYLYSLFYSMILVL
jgi:bisphosphoglycerate-dependent phosphoglycerate mutase